jgi:hypothetical protein
LDSLTTYTSSGAFVAKFNTDGDVQWVREIGSSGVLWVEAIEPDLSGNCYVSGEMLQTVFLDGYSVSNSAIGSNVNAYLFKLDSSGSVIWLKGIHNSAGNTAAGLCVDYLNRVCLFGNYNVSLLIDGVSLPPANPLNLYLSRFDGNGNLEWVKSSNTGSNALVRDIDTDNKGNYYFIGQYANSLSIDSIELYGDGTFQNNYIGKIDSVGHTKWLHRLPQGWVYKCETNNMGTTHVVGGLGSCGGGPCIDTAWFDYLPMPVPSGYAPMYIARYTTSGNLQCANLHTDGGSSALGVAIGLGGKTVVTGSFATIAFEIADTTISANTPQSFLASMDCDFDVSASVLSHEKGVRLVPNPTSGTVKVIGIDILEVRLFDLYGRLMATRQENQLDISGLIDGIYVALVITHTGIYLENLVKQ